MDEINATIFGFFEELGGISELSEFFSYLDGFDDSIKQFFSIIGLIVCFVGLLQCFLGYKLFRFWCSVVGLLVGLILGFALATSGILSASPAEDVIGILLVILLGITGSFIAYRAYLVGVFLYAFAVGFFAIFFVVALFTDSILLCAVVGTIAGVGTGIVAVLFRKIVIIISTSISGGMAACTGLMLVFQTTEIGYGYILPPVLMLAGFFVQNATTKNVTWKGDKPITIVMPPAYSSGSAPTSTVNTASAAPAVAPAESPPVEPAEKPPENPPENPPEAT